MQKADKLRAQVNTSMVIQQNNDEAENYKEKSDNKRRYITSLNDSSLS